MPDHIDRIIDLYCNGLSFIEIKHKITFEKGVELSIGEIKKITHDFYKLSNKISTENDNEFLELIPEHSYKKVKQLVSYFFKEKLIELSSGNKDLDYLIKTIVKDNIITEIEREFIIEKSLDLGFDQSDLKNLKKFLGVNNPYLDRIINMILEDGVVTDKELEFIIEKVKENKIDKYQANTRFWVIAFSKYFDKLIKIEGFDEIVKLIFLYLEFGFSDDDNDQYIFDCLNIFSSENFNEIITTAKKELSELLVIFIESKNSVNNIEKFIDDAFHEIKIDTSISDSNLVDPKKISTENISNSMIEQSILYKILNEEKIRIGSNDANLLIENIKYRIEKKIWD